LRSSADYFAVQNFWSQHEQVRNHISIHLVYARDADEPDDPTIGKDLEYNYPVNYLRNVARKYVQTNYVLYLVSSLSRTLTLSRMLILWFQRICITKPELEKRGKIIYIKSNKLGK